MKSPYTGKEMKRIYEQRVWNFRGEEFKYIRQSWLCEDSGERFTDDRGDTAGYVQVTNQYRAKYGIPFTDEIINIRRRYGISASKMSLILGIGINQYRLYEHGEVPNVSNGRMIRSIMNPHVMLDMVESSKNELSGQEYTKIKDRIKILTSDEKAQEFERYEMSRVFSHGRGQENGYAAVSLDRLKNTLLHILEKCGDVWYTKMNKLLFYTDFLAYREHGMAISGLSYRAIRFGPVPERWDKVYSEFPEIEQEFRQAGDFIGNVLKSTIPADTSLFTKEEMEILDTVCSRFGSSSSREISRMSHDEHAWQDYYQQSGTIPFEAAFSLKSI